ncbi:MAG TPA: universal stress protein [Candidatus Paceibacterota bacterium]|nr:universal stress protein [Candidatus Paceibacterota bacterium]
MKRFKNILLYTDGQAGSRFALHRAVGLAKRNQGRLTVVSVLEDLPRELLRLAAAMPSENLQSMAMQEVRERLETFVAPFQKAGSTVELEVLCGKPFIKIIRAVLRRQHDLVMTTAEGRRGLKETLFGSTSLHLMRKCPCPVWVLKPSRRPRFARIVAAVDPDPLDVVRDGVNTKIMELATSLAALEDAELHVVHAWRICEPALWRNWQDRVPKAQADDWVEQTREAHQRRFDELLGKFNLAELKPRLHLAEGEAGSVIPQLAAKERIDLIVMGTLARAGLEGLFIGNTAETVLARVACSVLTVKPEGFVSPVMLD